MADSVYAPLAASTIRTLTDKLYEKRKAAALEIEKNVRDYASANQFTQIDRVLDVLNELAKSHNPNTRKGGLIGLAAAAIALGKLSANYTAKLVLPALGCLEDSDARVRYYACEALYNIVKVTRESSLAHFNVLFDSLCRLAADTDQNVRSGSELLDRLLKDIASGAAEKFQVAEFMVLLSERIHTKNSNARRFLVSWLSTLYTVPQIQLLPYLPEVLDGLLQTLADPALNVREMCETVLGQFLQSVKSNPTVTELETMINVLIVHAQAPDDLVRYISLVWLREFLTLIGARILPFTSGFLVAVLPCLAAPEDHQRDIHEVARGANVGLMQLFSMEQAEANKLIHLESVVEVLKKHLNHSAIQTRIATLHWIHHLQKTMVKEIFDFMEILFPLLVQRLSDPADEVVLLDLEVLSDICQADVNNASPTTLLSLDCMVDLSPTAKQQLHNVSPYFVKFAVSLLDMFRRDPGLLSDRGSFIVRQLCLLLKPEQIFRSLAVLLVDELDLLFASNVVQTLNGILLTATELFQLRNQLKGLETEESQELFVCLYRCWCHQPAAVLALCLLSQNYEHAATLIQHFVDLDVSVEFLMEVDKLIQLLESPIFACSSFVSSNVRLDLLDPEHRDKLAAVLYGLLMLLPQTDAFHVLHRRLQSLPLTAATAIMANRRNVSRKRCVLPLDELLVTFLETQEKQKKFKRLKHRELMSRAA